jgi:hypothetical protein
VRCTPQAGTASSLSPRFQNEFEPTKTFQPNNHTLDKAGVGAGGQSRRTADRASRAVIRRLVIYVKKSNDKCHFTAIGKSTIMKNGIFFLHLLKYFTKQFRKPTSIEYLNHKPAVYLTFYRFPRAIGSPFHEKRIRHCLVRSGAALTLPSLKTF